VTLALDFGTCNTVLARTRPVGRPAETLRLGGLSRLYGYQEPGASRRRASSVVPSLVHFGTDELPRIGALVEGPGLAAHPWTFRWMKLDLLRGYNRARRVQGRLITPRQAADVLLQAVLRAAAAQRAEDDLVVTLPVEAYDPYVDWLQETVQRAFPGRVRMLDEATACILGYGARVREGQVYLVLDFGGGTLDVSLVKTLDLAAAEARPCLVLGRAGEELGGALVDQWLLQEVQEAQGLDAAELAELGPDLLHAVEDVKVRLSSGAPRVEIALARDPGRAPLRHLFTAADLRRALETERITLGQRSLYRLLALTLERALERAQERYGTRKAEIRAVFMVGGSSLLLGVAELVGHLFPHCPVRCEDPFEAIARGACRHAGGEIELSLVHDYCLRSWDPVRREYALVPVVPKGTRYPSDGPVSVKYLNAACEGATHLGMTVIERAEMVRPEDTWELVGGRLQRREAQWHQERALQELNPGDRELIHAVPPCVAGTRRFLAGFGVDAQKRLTLSLRDLDPQGCSFVLLGSGERIDLPIHDLPLVKL
jgi:molecular chaperone DnaK